MKKVILIISIALFTALELIGAVPTWAVNPSDYSNSMVMVGTIQVDALESVDSNDMVAAFINGEVRGVANLQYETAADRHVAYMIIYGNESSGNITFKLYDANKETELDAYNATNFVINGAVGNIASPFIWSNVTLGSSSDFVAFSFPESSGTETIGANSIEVPLASGTNVSALTATFTTSAGATAWVNSVKQTSGQTINDFSVPVVYEVRSEDGQISSSFTVSVTAANNPPTDLSLNVNNIDENNADNAVLGLLSAIDDDTDHTFSFATGIGDEDNGSFTISTNQLLINASLDFETKSSFNIRLKVTDGASQTFEKSLSISVNDLNESPTDISLSNIEISEHISASSLVGGLSNNDSDAGDTFVFFLTGTSADNAFFSVDGSNLITAGTFNHEVQSNFSVQILVTDAGSNTYEETFAISVTDANDAPTNISLDNQTVFENLPFGTAIGNLSATDEDVSDTYSYTLVTGTGDTDNSAVLVSGTQLLLNGTQDFETLNQLSIRLEVKDGSLASFEKAFVITIQDANDVPTGLNLSLNNIDENNLVNAVIGSLTATDDDTDHIFSFATGAGDDDNSFFTISTNQLLVNVSLDFESKNSYSVRLKVTDGANQTFEKSLSINVNDLNESPTAISLSNIEISEHISASSVIGIMSTSDADAGDTFVYSLTGTSADNAFFSLDGSNLITASAFNHEVQSSFSVQILVTDADSNTYQETIVITVANANDTPTDIGLDNQTVFENLPFGTVIGNLSATDEDVNDVQSYSLISGIGDADNSLVLISGNQLLLNNTLDFESKSTLSVRLEVKDAHAATYDKVFSIEVLDTNDSPTELKLSNTALVENESIGFVVGAFSVIDADPTTTSYSFIEGLNDNSFFLIEGGEIKTALEIDFETQDQYTIDVLATDIDNQSIVNRFVIDVSNVNESPTDILLSNNSINENIDQQRIIGSLSVIDQDARDTHIFSLLTGIDDNDLFVINSNTLQALESFNFESKQSYLINMNVTDNDGLVFNKSITIKVIDQNEAPIIVNPIGEIAKENATDIELSLINVFNDVDDGDAFTLSVAVPGEISLPVGIVFDSENAMIQITSLVELTSFEIHLTATDKGGLTVTDIIEVKINLLTGINDELVDVKVYPNPTSQFLNASETISSFRIIDMNGNIIIENSVLSNKIDVTHLNPGVYLLELVDCKAVKHLRFIKE